jgi:hypothetical protein
MTTTYTPGVCNIGPAERRKRQLGGYLGLAVTVLALVAFVVLKVPDPWRALVALPAAAGANGFLQSAMHFCVGFSMRGLYNMGPALGAEENVMDAEMRRKDQRKGLTIIGYSALIAAAVVVIAVLLP